MPPSKKTKVVPPQQPAPSKRKPKVVAGRLAAQQDEAEVQVRTHSELGLGLAEVQAHSELAEVHDDTREDERRKPAKRNSSRYNHFPSHQALVDHCHKKGKNLWAVAIVKPADDCDDQERLKEYENLRLHAFQGLDKLGLPPGVTKQDVVSVVKCTICSAGLMTFTVEGLTRHNNCTAHRNMVTAMANRDVQIHSAVRSQTPSVHCDFNLGDLFCAFLKARVNPNQGFELAGYMAPLLSTIDNLPQSRSQWYREWWSHVDICFDSIISSLRDAVKPVKGMLTLSVDGGTVKSLSCQAVFVVLHVGNMSVPLPPYLESSRGSSETAVKVLQGIQEALGLLDCNLGDVGFIVADRSSTNRSAYKKMCGAVEELLQDDDEEPELPGREGLSVVNNVVFVEDSQFYKSLSNTSIFVECLPHALHNSMKDFCRSPVIANKYKKCLDCVKFFGHSFFNSVHRRGRFLDFMKNFKKCHAGREKTKAEELLDLLVAGESIHSEDVRSLVHQVNPEWAQIDTAEHLSVCVTDHVEKQSCAIKPSIANAAPTDSPTRYALAHWGKVTFLASNYLAVEAFFKSEAFIPESASKLLTLLADEETKTQLLEFAVITKPAHDFLNRVGDSAIPCAHLIESWLRDVFGSLSRMQDEGAAILEGIIRKRTVDSETWGRQPWKAAAAFVPVKKMRPDASALSSQLPVRVPVDQYEHFCEEMSFSTASAEEKKFPVKYWEQQPPSKLRDIALNVLHIPCNVFSADRCVALSNTLFGERQSETTLEHFKQQLVCYGAFKA